jgi:hypothetical protein
VVKKRIGIFEIYVTGGAGAPVYTTITAGKESIGPILHKDLRDLEFAVSRAIAQARLQLADDDKDEIQ